MKPVWGSKNAWRYGAAALLIGGWAMPAAAADLGGDCCADLEERVAELEATTARKGNRKVSLTVSGWVNESVMWWDDGHESNTYVGTNPVEQSRFRFVGEAKIDKDWSAGYTLEIGVWGANAARWNQDSPDGSLNNGNTTANTLVVRKSSWFVKSNTYGKVSVGQDATATYHLLDDADTTLTRNFYDAEGAPDYIQNFFLRTTSGAAVGNNLTWGNILRGFNNSTPGDDGRRNVVRYDSPTFAGFNVATAWGEDDIWDIALIYKNTFGDFSFNGRAGYGQSTDGASTPCHGSGSSPDNALNCEWWGVSAQIQHVPTGLYAYGGYGNQHDGSNNAAVAAKILDKDSETWFIQGGIEKKWLPLGKTNFFGEYRRDDAGSFVSINSSTGAATTVTQGANVKFWAVGAAQNIEAAETTLYLLYQHADGDVVLGSGATPDLSSFSQVVGGAKINF
ncbi:porin [Hyphomicrobium sp.]|uniref:porin n=1 Tax=Hyphomicrobium sp. TaxID=82 RepID=UPI000FA3B067|nr:porin [Hyphomicrobium sp.]RUO99638.1 MAG: porin [Hyphomicrobium sp.]